MQNPNSNIQEPEKYLLLLQKLEEFKKKYYQNLLFKGLFLVMAILLGLYLILIALEYISWFNSTVRTIIFYCYLALGIIAIAYYIAIPLLKINKIGKVLNNEETGNILVKSFPQIKDLLINVLQLHNKYTNENNLNSDLLIAAINQKIEILSPIPFVKAIDYKKTFKIFKYTIIPIILLLLLLIINPSFIIEPTQRIISHEVIFEKPLSYKISIENKKLQALQNNDFELNVNVEGSEIPNEIKIHKEGSEYYLKKSSKGKFVYTFKNLQKDINFSLTTEEYNSPEYTLHVLPKATLLNMTVSIEYPSYIGKKNEEYNNTGDITVPQGSKITWNFTTKDTKELWMQFGNNNNQTRALNNISFLYAKKVFQNEKYTIRYKNDLVENIDSVSYNIQVVSDEFPNIQVDEFKDSLYLTNLFFKGNVQDDYGFNKLIFHISKKSKEKDSTIALEASILPGLAQQSFFYDFDLRKLNLKPGESIEYYFEIFDNDAVNGFKSTKSKAIQFKLPTIEEINEKTSETNNEIKKDLEKNIKETNQIQKQIDDLIKKSFEKKQLNWEEKKQLKDLIEKQKKLMEENKQIQKENLEKTIKENQFNDVNDEEILEKQKQLEKMMEEMMSPEMKELLKQFEELLNNQQNKDKVNEMLQKMKLNNQELNKQMDKNLELFKRLEFDVKLMQTIKKVEDLAKEQKDLKEQTESKNVDNKQLEEKQKDIENKFEDIKKDFEDLDKKMQDIDKNKDFKVPQEKQNEISKKLKQSVEQLKQKQNKKASETQKDIAEQMEQLQEEMEKMQEEQEQEEDAEDAESLRRLLDNLVKVSLEQEALMNSVAKTQAQSPLYVKNLQHQKKLKDDIKMISDTLHAISKRQPEIKSVVDKEISQINRSIDNALNFLVSRNIMNAATSQQFSMTSMNNLALLLDESLKNMENNMKSKSNSKSKSKSKSKSNSSCPMSGNNKKDSFKSLREMQENLAKQIEMMKNGQMPKNSQGKSMGMSEQLARLAAQQEAIRKKFQEMNNKLKEQGYGVDKNVEKISKDMEQTETDIVNKIINQQTIKRQQDILTRLLESEKAEQEREMEEKRLSNESKFQNFSNPNTILEYNKLVRKEEMLKNQQIKLKPFYKNKVNQYFNTLIED